MCGAYVLKHRMHPVYFFQKMNNEYSGKKIKCRLNFKKMSILDT